MLERGYSLRQIAILVVDRGGAGSIRLFDGLDATRCIGGDVDTKLRHHEVEPNELSFKSRVDL